MAKYIGLIQFTEQGIRAIQDSPSRAQGFERKAKELGASIEALYWTVGAHDGVVVVEAPDDQTISALFLWLARAGNVRTQTLRAFDRAEMQKVLARAT